MSDYISSVDEAIAARISICAHPVVKTDLETVWARADFVFNDGAPEVYQGMMDNYDKGLCNAIAAGISDIRNSEDIMKLFCERGLVSTGSLVLEKPIVFPIDKDYVAAFSHWMYEGQKQGITFSGFEAEHQPPLACPLELSTEPKGVDELLAMTPANFAFPITLLVVCAIVALLIHCYERNHGRLQDELKKIFEDYGGKSLQQPPTAEVSDSDHPPKADVEASPEQFYSCDFVLPSVKEVQSPMEMMRKLQLYQNELFEAVVNQNQPHREQKKR